MAYEVLNGLEPKAFFDWFGAVAEIPHGSRKEQKLVAFLMDFAAQRGLEASVDADDNVFMTVPATPGYEQEPTILMQAHMDMVWEKAPGLDFDFETQPLRLRIVDGRLMGQDTTLGADNSVGTATMLALADSKDIPHPKLELLFTSKEEIGLLGIRAFDMSKITARRMLNFDCGYSHMIAVSSAGSLKRSLTQQFPVAPLGEEMQVLHIHLTGGRGGHSGRMINCGRACAVHTLATMLADTGVQLCALQSEGKAIYKAVRADIAVPKSEAGAMTELLYRKHAAIRKIYGKDDPDLAIEITEGSAANALSVEDSQRVFTVMTLFKAGATHTNGEQQESTITSMSIGSAKLENGLLELLLPIRSSIDEDKQTLHEMQQRFVRLLGMELVIEDDFSGWPEDPNAQFRKMFQAAHRRVAGFDAELERVHGGVEPCIIVGAIPDMDVVGYAPTAHGAHTTEEFLQLDEVPVYWDVLLDVLAQHV